MVHSALGGSRAEPGGDGIYVFVDPGGEGVQFGLVLALHTLESVRQGLAFRRCGG